MDKELRLTKEEQRAVDNLKEECDYLAFANYLERNHMSSDQLYSEDEFGRFKEKRHAVFREHDDSEQLKALKCQCELLLDEAEYDDGKLLYNHQESIDSDSLEKVARINYYTIIEMQRCGYSPDEIEYLTYYWPY